MRIISKIEINYFRSTYAVTLKNVNHLNVLVGGNDAGKSNVLKALNLFFNNQTEHEQSFYFLDDLTRKREQEARTAKGRATIWMKVHFVNFLNWKSLPKEFVIKKSWNRYSEQPEVTFQKGLSATSVARFLNKISFHYVPAVRGRDIFAHFLTLLHDSLLEDEKVGFLESAQGLMTVINDSTTDMAEKIEAGVGVGSTIRPPTDLRVLFNALDFATDYDEHSIPLQKRGDGIQSRHIPFILDFVARHSNSHHIWAYEEPETSLELGPAFELAHQFLSEFSDENQIFVTTHSPAFYDLEGENVSKWLVYQNALENGPETAVEEVTSEDLIDSKLGVAALIAKRAKEAYAQIAELKSSVERLDAELSDSSLAHVIVEGITDKRIIDEAFRRLYPGNEPLCRVVHAGGASNIAPYIKSAKVLSKEFSYKLIGLFDRDQEGWKQIRQFSESPFLGETEFRRVSSDRELYIGLLPISDELIELEQAIKGTLGNEIRLPIPIEFMFPSSVIEDALNEGAIVLDDRIAKANDPELPTNVNLSELYSAHLTPEYQHLAKKVRRSSKASFCEWVLSQPDSAFASFQLLFDQMEEVLQS